MVEAEPSRPGGHHHRGEQGTGVRASRQRTGEHLPINKRGASVDAQAEEAHNDVPGLRRERVDTGTAGPEPTRKQGTEAN